MRTAAKLFSWSLSASVPSRQPSTSTSAVEKTRAVFAAGCLLSSAASGLSKGHPLLCTFVFINSTSGRNNPCSEMIPILLRFGSIRHPRNVQSNGFLTSRMRPVSLTPRLQPGVERWLPESSTVSTVFPGDHKAVETAGGCLLPVGHRAEARC